MKVIFTGRAEQPGLGDDWERLLLLTCGGWVVPATVRALGDSRGTELWPERPTPSSPVPRLPKLGQHITFSACCWESQTQGHLNCQWVRNNGTERREPVLQNGARLQPHWRKPIQETDQPHGFVWAKEKASSSGVKGTLDVGMPLLWSQR